MYLSSSTHIQFSFKDPCQYQNPVYITEAGINLISYVGLFLIKNKPAQNMTFEYFLSEYPMTSSLNMQLASKRYISKLNTFN